MASETRSGPALIEVYEVGSDTAVDYSLTDDDQMGDCSFTISRDQFEHKTQRSSKPVKYVITGLEGRLEMSISNVALEKIASLFSTETTPATPAAGAKAKIVLKDQAGKVLTGRKVVIKPYPLLADPGATPAPEVAAAYQAWKNSWITFPNGSPVDVNGTNLAFGLQTQQEIKIAFISLPDTNGVRIIFGDETAA